jgi:hypothetical protein
VAILALLVAALQGPAFAATFIQRGSPAGDGYHPWTHDWTTPEQRAMARGLATPQTPPGARLALWPGVRNRMRNMKVSSTDFADAGYFVVSAWTKQRTMRALVEGNDGLFLQEIELVPALLCNPTAARFLQLRYLLRPSNVPACGPWTPAAGVLVDNWLQVDTAAVDRRAYVVDTALLDEPITQAHALSPPATLLTMLRPLADSVVTLTKTGVRIQLGSASAAEGTTVVLPVAYDTSWQSSSGRVRSVGGLLALTGVSEADVTLRFVPDAIAIVRATAMTITQVLVVIGLVGLAYVGAPRHGAFLLHGAIQGGRSAVRRLVPFLPHRRDWVYLAFAAVLMPRLHWTAVDADETGLLTMWLFPATALVVARIARTEVLYRWGAGLLATLVLGRVAAAGSLSAEALHDPLFWAIVAAAAFVASALTGRWPATRWTASAVGGACTATAVLLPLPAEADWFVTWQAVSGEIGPAATILLIAACCQAIGIRWSRTEAIGIAVRGALVAGLAVYAMGDVPNVPLEPAWVVALGVAVGWAEAGARRYTAV